MDFRMQISLLLVPNAPKTFKAPNLIRILYASASSN